METEYGGYHKLQGLRFDMDISLILALAIIQNIQCDFFKLFLN